MTAMGTVCFSRAETSKVWIEMRMAASGAPSFNECKRREKVHEVQLFRYHKHKNKKAFNIRGIIVIVTRLSKVIQCIVP